MENERSQRNNWKEVNGEGRKKTKKGGTGKKERNWPAGSDGKDRKGANWRIHERWNFAKEIFHKLFCCAFVHWIGFLLVCDGDELFAWTNRRKWSFDGQHAVLAQRGLDALWVGAFWKQELAVVLPVHRFALRFLLVFCVDLGKRKSRVLESIF